MGEFAVGLLGIAFGLTGFGLGILHRLGGSTREQAKTFGRLLDLRVEPCQLGGIGLSVAELLEFLDVPLQLLDVHHFDVELLVGRCGGIGAGCPCLLDRILDALELAFEVSDGGIGGIDGLLSLPQILGGGVDRSIGSVAAT